MISLQMKLLLAAIATLAGFTSADYHIGFVMQDIEFAEPMNFLADGSCCDSSCSDESCCISSQARCSPTLRLCFREAGHPIDDTESCPLLQVTRNEGIQRLVVLGTDNAQIERFYTGALQLYIRLSQFNGEEPQKPDFEPPFTDPLIDEMILNFTISAVTFPSRQLPLTQQLEANGKFDRVKITLSTHVHCAENWIGTNCEIFCTGETDSCNQVYSRPPVDSTSDSSSTPTTPPNTPPTPPNIPPTAAVVSPTNSNIVGLVVGVSVGVVVLILFLVCAIIVIILIVKRKMTWRRTFKPQTVSYTIPKRNLQGLDIQVVRDYQDDSNDIYSTITKKKQRAGLEESSVSVPPPVPPFKQDEDSFEDDTSTTDASEKETPIVYMNYAAKEE